MPGQSVRQYLGGFMAEMIINSLLDGKWPLTTFFCTAPQFLLSSTKPVYI